ncbi:hypothetical protein FANTH_14816, partial [Fusarium anthophilum]
MQKPEVAVCPETSDRVDIVHSPESPELNIEDLFNVLKEELKQSFINGEDKIEPILETLPSLLEKEINIQEITIPSKGKMIVVGDIHGQLRNLIEILHREGPPSAVHYYLFNGDIVDRGPSSVECAMLVFYLRYRFPDYVFINRGNHEDHRVNVEETFSREIKQRGFQHLDDIFQQCFHNLSLGKIIKTEAETYLALHGGIPLSEGNPLSIEDMNGLERNMSCTDKQAPLAQILWNDMSDENGNQKSQRHGWGLKVGQEALKRFLSNEDLGCLIRSHTEEPDGWRLGLGYITGMLCPSLPLIDEKLTGLKSFLLSLREQSILRCHGEDQWVSDLSLRTSETSLTSFRDYRRPMRRENPGLHDHTRHEIFVYFIE